MVRQVGPPIARRIRADYALPFSRSIASRSSGTAKPSRRPPIPRQSRAIVGQVGPPVARRIRADYALRIDMTKPKPKDQLQKRGRKSDFRPEYILIAKACARFGAIEDEIANELNIGPATLDRWKQKYPEFRCALKAGKDAFDDRIERSLYQRVVGWGNLPPDVTACIFWLKNRRKGAPEFYFDDAQAAYEQMSTEITRGKIKIRPA